MKKVTLTGKFPTPAARQTTWAIRGSYEHTPDGGGPEKVDLHFNVLVGNSECHFDVPHDATGSVSLTAIAIDGREAAPGPPAEFSTVGPRDEWLMPRDVPGALSLSAGKEFEV